MDLLSGLSAASTAIGIAKDLREIDRSVDEAGFKLKLAELTSALADTKLALTDAKEIIARLESELDQAKNGELCPKCRVGRLNVTEIEPNYQFGLNHYGVEKWTYQCDGPDCDFLSVRMHDPSNVLPKVAAGMLR